MRFSRTSLAALAFTFLFCYESLRYAPTALLAVGALAVFACSAIGDYNQSN